MRALVWHGVHDVRVDRVPDPVLLNPRDAIVRVTSTAICGSDLHLYDGRVPSLMAGDILGHEFMGEVVALGRGVHNLEVGDRVVVPFPIACGACGGCGDGLFSLCENSNPNAYLAERAWGRSPSGIFGYSHLVGGYAGGQAEYVRVPYADVGPLKVPEGLADEQVLFLSDILPTGWMAAQACGIEPGDTVAVWGCGPVGQFAIRSAFLMGAERVIAIDRVGERLRMAEEASGAIALDYEAVDVRDALAELTGGVGPDHCIDAVGLEAHVGGLAGAWEQAKLLAGRADRAAALRQAILACRNGGTVSVPGVYGGIVDAFPMGAVMNRSITIRTGQTHVHRYMRPLLERIERGEIDPAFVITHRLALDEAPQAYRTFRDKHDGCIKVVMRP